MKDLPFALAPQCGEDGLNVTSNIVSHSIVNSVTNDEDDLLDYGNNGGNSVVNGVSNDEDEWIERRKDSRDKAESIQYCPCNYRSAFSKEESKKTDFIIPPSLSLSNFERKYISNDYLDKKAFLIRYEQMIREQEEEQIRTISHLQFFLELLTDLQLDRQGGVCKHQRLDRVKNDPLLIEFSINDLKEAQNKIKNSKIYDVVKTDEQFMMVLEIICEDNYRIAKTNSSETKEMNISWAEIIQCYRDCVAGMQTLEIIGSHDIIRKRTKVRTLAVLSSYRESLSFNYSSSTKVLSKVNSNIDSEITNDMSVDDSFRVNRRSQLNSKSRGLLNFALNPVLIGAMAVAILFYVFPSEVQLITQHKNTPSVRELQQNKCLVADNESFHSIGRSFKAIEKITADSSIENSISHTMNVSQDLLHGTLKRKNLIQTTGHAMPTTVSDRIRGNAYFLPLSPSTTNEFDPKANAVKEYDDNIGTNWPSSFGIKVTNTLLSSATILYLLPSSFGPIAAVLSMIPAAIGIMSNGTARSMRDRIANIWKNLKFTRKKKNTKRPVDKT